MTKNLFTPRFIFIVSVIFAAAIFRLLPHWPNFTPIAAIALFGGTYISRKSLAFAIPILAMLVSDAIIGFHSNMLAVYISFSIIVMIGFLVRKKIRFGSVLIASVSGSVIFFILTNFSSWISSPLYAKTWEGLVTCYIAGLPFFNNGIMGDIFYNAIIFGGFYFIQQKYSVLAGIKSE